MEAGDRPAFRTFVVGGFVRPDCPRGRGGSFGGGELGGWRRGTGLRFGRSWLGDSLGRTVPEGAVVGLWETGDRPTFRTFVVG